MKNLLGLFIIAGIISAGSLQEESLDPNSTEGLEQESVKENSTNVKPFRPRPETGSPEQESVEPNSISKPIKPLPPTESLEQESVKINSTNIKPIKPLPPIQPLPPKPLPKDCWTDWMDRDNPSGTGDWETLSDFLKENPGKVCENPIGIEVLTTSGLSLADTGEVVTMNPAVGFYCRNEDQKDKWCHDYRVRFRCPASFCEACWTEWLDRDNPSGTGDWETLKDFLLDTPVKVCEKPIGIEALTHSGLSPADTGEVVTMNPAVGFYCRNEDQKDKWCHDYRVRFRCPASFCEDPIPDSTKPTHRCWTDWMDRDNPSGTGDWETLADLLTEHPEKVCEHPVDIEALTLTGLTPAAAGDTVTMDATTGFICKNDDQSSKLCNDYRVRFSCHAPFCAEDVCWTGWFDRDNPGGTGDWETLSSLHKQFPGKICKKPKYIEVVTVNNVPATATGQDFIIFNPTEGFVCKNVPGQQYCEDYKVRFGCCCQESSLQPGLSLPYYPSLFKESPESES